MFDFEKLNVYHKAKLFNKKMHEYLLQHSVDQVAKQQFKRAAFSIMLNIAEGTGRYTKRDKRHFYVMARGSAFECVAIIDFLRDINKLHDSDFQKFYHRLEEISKMLFSMIRRLE